MTRIHKESSIWPSLAQVLSFLIGGVTTLVGASVLGPAGWAAIALFTSLAALSALVSSMGLPAAVARGIDLQRLQNSRFSITITLFLITVVVAVVLSLFLSATASSSNFTFRFLLIMLSASTATHTLNEIALARLQADHRLFELSALRISNTAVPGITVVVTALLGLEPPKILILMVISQWFVLLGNILITRYLVRPQREKKSKPFILREPSHPLSWLSGTFSLFISSILLQLIFRSDVILASVRQPASVVGIFSLSVVLSEVLWFVTNGLAIADYPKLAKKINLQFHFASVKTSIFRSYLGALISIAFVGVLIQPVTNSILGDKFAPLPLAFWLMVPGGLLFVPVKIMMNFSLSRLNWRFVALIASSVITLKAILNLSIPLELGVAGPALASTIAYFFGFIVTWLYVIRGQK